MIYVIEPQCKSYEHINNNISFLRLLPLIFPNKSIKFFANSSHANVLNFKHGKEVVSDIAEIGDIKSTKIFLQKLLLMADKNSIEKIIFLSISSFQAYYVERLLRSDSFEVYLFMHYVSSELARRPSLRPHLFIKWLYFTLFFGSSSIKKIVYSKSIANNINKYLFNYNEVLFCNHPYDFSRFRFHEYQDNINARLKFVFPGEGRVEKGVLDFLKIGKTYINKKDISFLVAGRVKLDKAIYLDSGVDCIASDSLITDKEYQVRMENADYLVLLHNPEIYRYIYSGVLLDAIKYQKPIIALKNPVFMEFFERYGEIGYLLESIVEVRDLIGYLYFNSDVRYTYFKENINCIVEQYEKDTLESMRVVLQ